MTIRVWYDCDGSLPDETLGLAIAINQQADALCVSQFNTHCYHSDADTTSYGSAPFRVRPQREGFIEARIDPVQMRPGDYFLSVGLLPNLPDQWAFYEYHHLAYKFSVQANGWHFGSVFYPKVTWSHVAGLRHDAAA